MHVVGDDSFQKSKHSNLRKIMRFQSGRRTMQNHGLDNRLRLRFNFAHPSAVTPIADYPRLRVKLLMCPGLNLMLRNFMLEPIYCFTDQVASPSALQMFASTTSGRRAESASMTCGHWCTIIAPLWLLKYIIALIWIFCLTGDGILPTNSLSPAREFCSIGSCRKRQAVRRRGFYSTWMHSARIQF